jgi:hypothetical protein
MAVNINVTAAGAQPTPPATLRANLITLVAAERPGYTANLPGSLIEDISSTSVGALALIDQAAVDLLNSFTPNTANEYLLNLIGAQKGIIKGAETNSSAYILFTGIAGYTIPKGFVVGDGLNQYAIQDGGTLGNAAPVNFTGSIAGNVLTVSAVANGAILVGDQITGAGITAGTTITSAGTGLGGVGTYNLNNPFTISSEAIAGPTHGTATLFAVALQYGSWAMPANSINTIVTSVPSGYPLFCTNQNTGTVSSGVESPELYRARVLNSELSPGIGTLSYLKTLIQNVPGVQSRLVSVSGGNKIIVGGGDPYLVAGAIFKGMLNINNLVGSSATSHFWSATGAITGTALTVSAIAGGGVIQIGDIVSGAGLASPTIIMGFISGTGGNGTYLINYSQNVLSIAISGANSTRNKMVSIIDFPDTYYILFVIPIQQTVQVTVNWSTIAPNFTANSAVSDAVTADLVAYINSIPVGVAINTYSLQKIFLESLATIIEPSLISALSFTVKIDGIVTSPTPGTGLIPGDSEGFFLTNKTNVVVTRI